MAQLSKKVLKEFLEEQVERFNQPAFIPDDPIALPHQFSKLQDREIIGFWVAMLAWGQRKTILNKGRELVELMDGAPHDFVVNHTESDLKKWLNFKHRTFNTTDTLYFLAFLQWYYLEHDTLETAFAKVITPQSADIGAGLIAFHDLFFSLPDAPIRTRKHVATPLRKSSCKRLNMFLRWMVRNDDRGVDFGVWKTIQPRQLMMPLDVHVQRVATKMGLLDRKQADWRACQELTATLRYFDAEDPVKYDFAIFGLGVLSDEQDW